MVSQCHLGAGIHYSVLFAPEGGLLIVALAAVAIDYIAG